MKKKYLKKMLAIMLASMTVAATPGLVGAMREESRNAIKTVNAQVANQSLKKEDAISKLDEFEKIANEDDDAKKEVAKTLGDMINEGLFKRPLVTIGYYLPGAFEQQTRPPEYLSKIINMVFYLYLIIKNFPNIKYIQN